jgi:hypothetical protein
LCGGETPPEGLLLHVVRARALAVDLDDGEPFAIARLERGVAVDRDLFQLEAQLVAERPQLCERALAQRAAVRVEDRDARLTDRGPA